jgi:hypothetical protein
MYNEFNELRTRNFTVFTTMNGLVKVSEVKLLYGVSLLHRISPVHSQDVKSGLAEQKQQQQARSA